MRRLCLFFCLLCLSLAARADSFTPFTLNVTFSGGGTLTGSLVIDTTTNVFSSGDLVVSGAGANFDGEYNSFRSSGILVGLEYADILRGSGGNALLEVYVPVGNLVGYAGGNICSQTVGCTIATQIATNYPPYNSLTAASGTLLPQATPTPEPSTLLSLATALTLGACTQRRRLFA